MAVDIGPKIGLEGENEFRKQIKQVNEEIKTLGTEMKATEAAFAGQEKTTEALTAKSKVLREEIDKQQQKVALLTKGLQESAEKYGENDEKTLKWQQAVNNATAQLSKMEHELNATTKELDNEGASADKAGKETKDAGNDAKDSAAGWKALGDTVAAVGAAMAAAAAAAAAAIAEAGKALVSFTVDAAGYADDIMTMSSITGMSTEKLQELQYAAELVDVSVDTITGSMKKNLSAMTKVQAGNKDMTAAYDKLGVAVLDANGNLRDDEDVYWDLINALGKVEDETERDVLAMQILGKSASDLNPLIDAGADALQAYAVQAHDAGYVLSEESLDAFGEFDDQLRKLDVGATAAKNALGTILLPVLTDLAGEGVDLLGQFTTGILDADGDISKMAEVVDEVLPQVLDAVMEYLPDLLDLVISIMGAVGQSILDNLDLIIDSVVTLIEKIIDGLAGTDALVKIIDAAVRIVIALAEGLIKALPQLIRQAPIIIAHLATAIVQAAPQLLKAAWELIVVLATGIANALQTLVQKGREMLDSVKQGFKERLDSAKQWGRDLIQNFIDGITAKWQDLKNSVSSVASTVKSFLGFSEPEKGPLSNFHTFAPDMIDLFIKGLQQGQARLQRQLEETFDPASMTAGVADVTVGGAGGMAVTIPLNIDGQKLTQVIAQIQWAQGTAAVRNYGASLA